MILTNEREYQTTEERLADFRDQLAALEGGAAGGDWGEAKRRGMSAALLRTIAKLEGQLKDYDDLRAGRVTVIECDGLDELPRLLVRARVARGVSAEDLALKLGWRPGRVVRYEESEYEGAPWAELVEVADALRLRVRPRVDLSEPMREDEELPDYAGGPWPVGESRPA